MLTPPKGPGPKPSFALLGQAWKINFKHLGVFLLLALIDYVIYGALSSSLEDFQHGLGLPVRIEDYNDLQWLIWQLTNIATKAFVTFPFNAVVYCICFRVFDQDPSPIDGVRSIGDYYWKACAVGLIVNFLMMAVDMILRLAARDLSLYLDLVANSFIEIPFMLVLPAIVRYDLSLGEAFRYSFRRINETPFGYMGYWMLAFLMSIVGIIGCGIGMILTSEIYPIAIALLLPAVVVAPRTWASPVSPYPRRPGIP